MAEGYEVWGGGTDGYARMWRNAGEKEGEHMPDAELKLHDDAVGSAVWHPGGAVLATCAGQRSFVPLDDDEESSDGEVDEEDGDQDSLADGKREPSPGDTIKHDNTMKLWTC